ncbi:MAG: hypothetical protein JW820_19825 [Spirochaetales bacterium]|nr:hypothetical protein [Spirochaetales bacterium]
MEILIVSDSPKTVSSFKLSRRSRLVSGVRILPWRDFRDAVRSVHGPALCYLDVSGLTAGRLREHQRLLSRYGNLAWALVDPAGAMEDAAKAFHEGAVDYVGKAALREGITAERLRRVQAYAERAGLGALSADAGRPAGGQAAGGRVAAGCESPADWSEIRAGGEYSFYLMFIELDGKELMEKKYGADNLSVALASFRTYLEGFVRPYQGRLWTWFRFGGIVLFPFSRDGSHAVTCLFRLMLFRHFYDIESSHFPNFLSFRVAMHLGNLVYDEANTGRTVSDSLNSVFHLGQQYASPGEVCVTQEVVKHGPPVLQDFFSDAGTFEGRKILKMRLPVHGG